MSRLDSDSSDVALVSSDRPRTRITRRSMLKAGLGAAGVAGLGGLSAAGSALAQSETRLRMFWWGSKERAERTDATNKLFMQKNPAIRIDGESLGWNDYWARVATQAAGRNVPDVLQMDYRYIFEYARRGALLPLDPYVGKGLAIEDFGQAAIDSGKVDGKIYGVSLGLNSTTFLYDTALLEQLKLKAPAWPMTWDEMGELAGQITKAVGKPDFYGVADGGGEEPGLEIWLRQRGKSLYTNEAKLGYDAGDIEGWFGFWDKLRKSGACARADVQALYKGEIDTSLLTIGKAAMSFAHSNQLVGYQALNKSKLSLTAYPTTAGGKPGQYLKPSMLFSVAARAKAPEAAVKVVDFYVADLEAGKALGVERGVAASKRVRDAVVPTLDPLGAAMAQYVAFMTDKVGALPPPPPQGAGEIERLLRRMNEQVGFGRSSVADGAKQFVSEATGILARG